MPGEPGGAADVTINAQLFGRNPKIDAAVFAFIEDLPSFPAPDVLANPLRRAKSLVSLLTDDAVPGGPMLADAGENLSQALNARLDGLAAEHAAAVQANIDNIEMAGIRRTSVAISGDTISTSTRVEETAARDMDRNTRRVLNSIKDGVGKDYLRYRVSLSGPDADIRKIRTSIAALLMIDGVASEVEKRATKWAQDRFSEFAVEIKNTTGATKDAYLKVKEQTSAPEQTTIELTTTLKAPVKDSNRADAIDLPTFTGHLYALSGGKFPAKLNDWESKVLETELGRPSFVAWYRNPSRAVPSSLRIAYKDDSGDWGSLQVDFIIISRRDDGSLAASIVDPHGDHLADAKAKLRGLADYAEKFGDSYIRIEGIAKIPDGRLRSLDLLSPKVREAVRQFGGGKVTSLYESSVAEDFK